VPAAARIRGGSGKWALLQSASALSAHFCVVEVVLGSVGGDAYVVGIFVEGVLAGDALVAGALGDYDQVAVAQLSCRHSFGTEAG